MTGSVPALLAGLLAAGASWLLLPGAADPGRLSAGSPGGAGSARSSPAPVAEVPGRLETLRRRWRTRMARDSATEARAAAVVELVEAMAAELRAGQPPPRALAAAAAATPVPVVPAAAVAASRASGPVADLLDVAAAEPGAAGLHAVASCWRVAEQSGAGLASGLERVGAGLRDEHQVAREVAGQLAAPRATGTLLALLPLFGLLLGSALGAEPLHVLLTTPYGWACLALGVPLQVAGWWWVHGLAAAVSPWRR